MSSCTDPARLATIATKYMEDESHGGKRIRQKLPEVYAFLKSANATTAARWQKLCDILNLTLVQGTTWGYQANENPFGRQGYVLKYNFMVLLMTICDTSRTLSDEENDAFFQVVEAANWTEVSAQEHKIEGNTVLIAKKLCMSKQDPAFYKEYAALAGVTL